MTRYDREPLSPLRRRYIDDLRLRNKSPRTIETYVLRVALFTYPFGRLSELRRGHTILPQKWTAPNRWARMTIKDLAKARKAQLVPKVESPQSCRSQLPKSQALT